MRFTKYQAAGNDFIVIEAANEQIDGLAKAAPRLCDRHFGIGADGILAITPNMPGAQIDCDAAMHVLNADGSIAAMCGNGIRCVARYLYECQNIDHSHTLKIATRGGTQTVRLVAIQGNTWQLEVVIHHAVLMHTCQITQNQDVWHGQCVDVGNPHAVFEVQESPKLALAKAGEFLSNHDVFPDRCNIEFIRPISPLSLEFAVYERGAGPTLACGTGCVAAALAYANNHSLRPNPIQIHAPGGILTVTVPKTNDEKLHLMGPANRVFSGDVNMDAM